MTKFAALSFRSYEDFEACNEAMNIKPGDTATSSDGMFTVMIKTERLLPPGTLMVTTGNGRKVFVRVISGTEEIVSSYTYRKTCSGT